MIQSKNTKKSKTEIKKVDERAIAIQDKVKELLNMRIDHRLGKLKNPKQIKKARREIARMKTKISLERFIHATKE